MPLVIWGSLLLSLVYQDVGENVINPQLFFQGVCLSCTILVPGAPSFMVVSALHVILLSRAVLRTLT